MTTVLSATRSLRLIPGLVVCGVSVVVAALISGFLPSVGILTGCLMLGVFSRNLDILPEAATPGIVFATKRLLRAGVIVLGFQLSFGQLREVGASVLLLILITVAVTFSATVFVSRRLGHSLESGLLIAAGFSICGASAIAAMESVVAGEDDDVMISLTLVTLFGTIAMVAVPVLGPLLGLDDVSVGIWAGAAVHEVAQVIVAAEPVGSVAVGVAISVKLARVVLLAPVIGAASWFVQRGDEHAASRRPILPMFVVGFVALATVRTLGVFPDAMVSAMGGLQTVLLGAAMFGMGTHVHLRRMLGMGVPGLVVGAVSTVVAAGTAYLGLVVIT